MATSSIPPVSGIYKITCTANGKIYIGSSVNTKRRWNTHRSCLRRNAHCNLYLQNAWSKYGENAFVFEVFELVAPSDLLEREQYWLNTLQPYERTGYNIALRADSPTRGRNVSAETRLKLRNVHLGKPKSLESRTKLSAARKGIKFSEETCARISKGKKGQKPSAETRAKLRENHKNPTPEAIMKSGIARRKSYIVTTPDGAELEVKGLTVFCQQNGLSPQAMSNVACGRKSHYKGWKCRHAD